MFLKRASDLLHAYSGPPTRTPLALGIHSQAAGLLRRRIRCIHQPIRLVGPFSNRLGQVPRPLANLARLIHFQIPLPGHRHRIPKDARQRRKI